MPNAGSSLTARTRAAALNGEIQPVLYVSGTLQIKGTGQLNPALMQPGLVSRKVLPGDYSVELRNAQGELLYRLRFTGSFVNPDGDKLVFDVLYSPDDGRNWRPLARGVSGQNLIVNSLILPGGANARIRVLATDGLYTAQDDSDKPFTVVDKPPAPFLLRPAPMARPRANEIIAFRADPNDLENPDLPEEACLWSVDGEFFGVGRNVEAILPEGNHVIQLLVRDDRNQVGEIVFDLEVQPPALGELQIVLVRRNVVRISWLATLGCELQVAEDVAGPYRDTQVPIELEGYYFVTELNINERTLFFRLLIAK